MTQPEPGAGPDPVGSGLRCYLPLLVAGIALGMHLTIGVAYALTAFLAPGWAVLLLALWWLVLLLTGLLLAARRAAIVLAVPIVALLSWAAALAAGDHFLGWNG